MRDEWVEVVPRLYLDTCTIADALLEPELKTRPAGGRDLERFLSQRIFRGWPETNLVISPFVLAEFMQLGKHPNYSRSIADMRRIVDSDLLTRTKMTFTSADLSLARAYDVMGIEPKFLVRLHMQGSATMPNGERFHGIKGAFHVTRAGQIVRATMGGIPEGSSGLDPGARWDADTRVTVEAPAFELAMLDTVAQIVHETNAPWKDAFHFLYANWGNASMILSTDEEFAKRTSGKTNLPKVVLPSYVEGRVKRLDPFYREVFC